MKSKFGDLNSIILEGELTSSPVVSNDCCTFCISNETCVYSEDAKKEFRQKETFIICTTGHSAKLCNSYLAIGDAVRLRGTLRSSNSGLFILAIYIEFRRTKGKELNNESQIS